MTTATASLTSVSAFQQNESYPEHRLRFSQSDVFARIAEFIRMHATPLGLDSLETDPDFRSPRVAALDIDFATPEDVDFFLSTIGDKNMPGTSLVKTFISEDGCMQIDVFESNGLFVHNIDGIDASIVCVANHAGAVIPHWAEAFERCGVSTEIKR